MSPPAEWLLANQRHLMAAVAVVRAQLEKAVRARAADGAAGDDGPLAAAEDELRAAAAALRGPSAVAKLCVAFDLTPFERDVLLLAAGVELSSELSDLVSALHGDPRRGGPSFRMALAALPGAHWSAVTPSAPLRRHHLVELTPGDRLTQAALRIDERVLHFLAGVEVADERLQGVLEPLPPQPEAKLPAAHAAAAERLARAFTTLVAGGPLPELSGGDATLRRTLFARACAAAGRIAHVLRAIDVPPQPAERELFARLLEREALLASAAILLERDDADPPEVARAALALAERVSAPLALSTREPWKQNLRPTLRLEVAQPDAGEQHLLWEAALGESAALLNGQLERVSSHFALGPTAMRAASVGLGERLGQGAIDAGAALWDECRRQSRQRLEGLAHRLDAGARDLPGWDALVLPEAQRSTLREIAAQVRQRAVVYERWGFARRLSRGLGITALFAGPSGTGKTLAAEVLAAELKLDLYRIDLSQVVSKYIGDTEKNLQRIFAAAQEGGAILLFDEADALFGKRSEVKDSHDRYANIEVSYLLQQMESYSGLAVLTTNLKNALDTAFLRRIRFVVQFPFPDETQRAEIWRRCFPPEAPSKAIDVGRLARLHLPGGNIRNIALQAAFLAADEGSALGMGHLLKATRAEYAKLERPLTDAETGGWS